MTTTVITADRYHDISCGHRVFGHESKCAHAHGHNYRIHFQCEAPAVDSVGRVMDFSVIKSKLCMWLEDHWDHKFLLWSDDPWVEVFREIDSPGLVVTYFNPTAENMAQYLLNDIAPHQLSGSGVAVTKVIVEETRKCSASASLRSQYTT